MKKSAVCILLAFSLSLSAGSAGQPDPRFEGVWVGTESYNIFNSATQSGQSTSSEQATKSSFLKTLNFPVFMACTGSEDVNA